jgi:uncharacterized membrane protein YhaH (DUF805 family)
MRGEILSYDTTAGTGLISGDDGVRYSFVSSGLQSPAVPAAGVRVDFVPEGAEATQILILAGAPSTIGVAGGLSASTNTTVAGFDWQKLMFSFEGRTQRSHFWIGWLILLGAGVVAGWLPIIGFLISIALIWPNLAIAVKRLHDMGHSGWLVLVPWVATLVLMVVAFSMMGMQAIMNSAALENEDPAAILALIGPAFGAFGLLFVINIGFLLWIGLVEGQRGDNRFGPNPKGE